ncbi:NUDIX hydrolase [Pseudalkalibacillus caeni]|uniref:NUDIX domain-containing protein n=1 Tax=Exobacillus caeni TaxID=2574798 RepID=A0A5R9F7L8_9BACL|nr:NUDIX hydrolase [Pseudalkalibacillus caeni]TLS38250.1 NUDIX domain-containing protein [Pseudalkalibacillus caeni]
MGYMEEMRELVGHRPLILPGAVAVVVDQERRILLQQRLEPARRWGLPGGLMELGESLEETARRETFEETGLTLGELHLIGLSSGPQNYVKASNGDEFYSVTASYYTTAFSGELKVNLDESTDARFIDPRELPERMVGSHRKVIKTFLEQIFPDY